MVVNVKLPSDGEKLALRLRNDTPWSIQMIIIVIQFCNAFVVWLVVEVKVMRGLFVFQH